MHSIQTIDFGSYDALYKMMKDPNFDSENLPKLDFSNGNHSDIPPGKALKILKNLRIILLSKNKISRFDVTHFTQDASLLQEIDLSFNNISVLDDIIELGSLKHLRVLNLKENPVIKKFLRIKLVEFLLFPAKYKPYNAVKILTATYDSVQDNSSLDPKAEEASKKFYRMMEKKEEELADVHRKKSRLNKYDHQDTQIKLSMQACPVPRKTRFPMLTMLNEQIISIQEVQSILMVDDLSEVVIDPEEGKGEKFQMRADDKMHKKYLLKYMKKKERKRDVQERFTRGVGESQGKSEEDLMKELLEKPKIKSGTDYQDEMWTKPPDVHHKDAEFTIGISDFKKSLKEYKENKEKEKEKQEQMREEHRKQMKMKSEASKKKKKMKSKKEAFEFLETINADEIEDDNEIKRVFNKRFQSKAKPKLKLEMNYNVEQDTSDTEVEEKHDWDEKSDWSESDFYFDQEEEEERKEILEDGSPVNKSSSPKNMKKLVKQMTLLRISFKGDKKEEGKGLGDSTTKFNKKSETFGEEVFQIHLTGLNPQTRTTSIMLPEKRETSEINTANQRSKMSVTPNPGKRGRRFFVVNDSGPNLSVSSYGKSKEKSVEVSQNYFGGKGGAEAVKKYLGNKKEEVKEENILSEPNLLGILIDDRSEATPLFSVLDQSPISNINHGNQTEGTRNEVELEKHETSQHMGSTQTYQDEQLEEINKYKLDKLGGSFEQDSIGPFQPEQNPLSPVSPLERAQENPLADQEQNNTQNTPEPANIVESAYKKALDILGPLDQKNFDHPEIKKTVTQEVSNANNRHIKVFSTSSGTEPKTLNQSFGPADGTTTGDPSLFVFKEELPDSKSESKNVTRTVSRAESNEKYPRDTNKVRLRKGSLRAWDQQRHSLSTSYSTKSFKITTALGTPSSKSPSRFASYSTKAGPQLMHLGSLDPVQPEQRQVTPVNLTSIGTVHAQTTTSLYSLAGLTSVNTIQSPARMSPPRIRFADQMNNHEGDNHSPFTFDQTPDKKGSNMNSIMAHMNNKAKEARHAQTPEGGRMRSNGSNAIMVQNGIRPGTAAPRRTKVEDLIPGPEDGVPESVKMRILNNRGAKYFQLLETAKMLDETDEIIRQSNALADSVTVNQLKRPIMETVDPRIVRYDELTEFLREFEKKKRLKFADNMDIRKLGELVNEYTKLEEEGMNKLDMELKLRKLKEETIGLEGDALQQKFMEIERFNQYLDLMENLDAYKDNTRNTKKMGKLQDKAIKKAEHNAILAAHYLKLRNFCSQEYLNKFMDDDLRMTNNLGDDNVISNKRENTKGKRPSIQVKLDMDFKKSKEDDVDIEPKGKDDEKTKAKQETLLQYIKKIKKEKTKALRDYPYTREVPVYTDDKHRWLNVSLVKKYEHKPMLKIEELMDQKRRKTIVEYHKMNPNDLTPAEKAIRYAQEFKDGMKKTKVLNAKVDKYIQEGTKNLDDLLVKENKDIEVRFNQKQLFTQFMDMLAENKL